MRGLAPGFYLHCPPVGAAPRICGDVVHDIGLLVRVAITSKPHLLQPDKAGCAPMRGAKQRAAMLLVSPWTQIPAPPPSQNKNPQTQHNPKPLDPKPDRSKPQKHKLIS